MNMKVLKWFSKIDFIVYIVLLFVIYNGRIFGQSSTIELKNGSFYIDGKKFFVKGIGYDAGGYPGMTPWNHPFNQDILDHDMQRIADGGFNTIRTWSALTEQELQEVSKYNLKIIMGISIDQTGDFSNTDFINSSLQTIQNVLAYSKNYDNIIAYLVMNEPQPDHVFTVGYKSTVSFWKQMINQIHQLKPGVPVSVSNTCVSDYIDPEIYDFTAFNIYPYNPATVNFSHYYPAYVKFIKSLRNDDRPLIVTEYGLSVSPTGPGNWGYGGNTLDEQEKGILYMYRSLIDGGASGSCVFQYSDGWAKAGNEFVHDDSPEEWFGLVEYTSVDDKYGIPRPVWDSLIIYNRVIIESPRNQEVYNHAVPVEIISSDTVFSVEAWINGSIVMVDTIKNDYLLDTLNLTVDSLKDIQLEFYFKNSLQQIIKSENIQILVTKMPLSLPEININVSPKPEKKDISIQATYTLDNNSSLSTDSVLNCVFYPHVGWDYGTAEVCTLSSEGSSVVRNYDLSSDYNVITIAAGTNAKYGNFVRRIVNQNIYIISDTTAIVMDPDLIKKDESQDLFYPNPASEYIIINADDNNTILYTLVDESGRMIKKGQLNQDKKIDVSMLREGIYIVVIQKSNRQTRAATFIKD